MVKDKLEHLSLPACFAGLMVSAALTSLWNLWAGVAIILFCCSVLAFQALDHKQSKPGIVTSPAESKNEEGHHSSAGLETVFDYCPDCGAGDIVPGRDGKCTNCGYALMEELVKNSE